MPAGSSVGWFGCSRAERRPGSPSVLRKRVTTRRFAAISTRSWLRQIFVSAAAISGVRPGASAAKARSSVASARRWSRSPPTVRCDTGAKAAASWVSRMRRVTSSAS